MKNFSIGFLALLLSIPLYLLAHIEGTYEIKGTTPANIEYTGLLFIEKVGDAVFRAHWTFTSGISGTDEGTGVKKGNRISFVFLESEDISQGIGTQLYKINGDKLKGPWVLQGGTVSGFERAKKIEI